MQGAADANDDATDGGLPVTETEIVRNPCVSLSVILIISVSLRPCMKLYHKHN